MKFARLVTIISIAALILFMRGNTAHAQDSRLNIDGLSKLSESASESVDVTIDNKMLQLAAHLMSSNRSADEAKIKEIVSGLRGIYVKSYAFDSPGGYSQQDVDSIMSQLKSPAWSRVVGVMYKRRGQEKEAYQVYLMTSGDKIDGLAAICADRNRFTVINVVGSIDVEKLGELCGHFGIPKLFRDADQSN